MSSNRVSISDSKVVRVCSSPLASQALPGVMAKSRMTAVCCSISSMSSRRRARRGSVGCFGIRSVYRLAELRPERAEEQTLHGGHTGLLDDHAVGRFVGGHRDEGDFRSINDNVAGKLAGRWFGNPAPLRVGVGFTTFTDRND